MRMLMHVHLPLEPFNTAVRDGSAGQKMKRILEANKPEAAYFCEHDGQRGGTLVVNLDDPSGIPALAEPWFLTFNANVEFRVAMTPEDLARAGLEALGKQARRLGSDVVHHPVDAFHLVHEAVEIRGTSQGSSPSRRSCRLRSAPRGRRRCSVGALSPITPTDITGSSTAKDCQILV